MREAAFAKTRNWHLAGSDRLDRIAATIAFVGCIGEAKQRMTMSITL